MFLSRISQGKIVVKISLHYVFLLVLSASDRDMVHLTQQAAVMLDQAMVRSRIGHWFSGWCSPVHATGCKILKMYKASS